MQVAVIKESFTSREAVKIDEEDVVALLNTEDGTYTRPNGRYLRTNIKSIEGVDLVDGALMMYPKRYDTALKGHIYIKDSVLYCNDNILAELYFIEGNFQLNRKDGKLIGAVDTYTDYYTMEIHIVWAEEIRFTGWRIVLSLDIETEDGKKDVIYLFCVLTDRGQFYMDKALGTCENGVVLNGAYENTPSAIKSLLGVMTAF